MTTWILVGLGNHMQYIVLGRA